MVASRTARLSGHAIMEGEEGREIMTQGEEGATRKRECHTVRRQVGLSSLTRIVLRNSTLLSSVNVPGEEGNEKGCVCTWEEGRGQGERRRVRGGGRRGS